VLSITYLLTPLLLAFLRPFPSIHTCVSLVGKSKDGRVGVEYTLRTSTHVYSISVKETNTIEETLAQIRRKHPEVAMEQVQAEGAELDEHQPIISPLVEVRILWRGTERTMPARNK
jgi:hypothetical protein